MQAQVTKAMTEERMATNVQHSGRVPEIDDSYKCSVTSLIGRERDGGSPKGRGGAKVSWKPVRELMYLC